MTSAVVYRKSINKFGEEVCGDNFQLGRTEDSKIVVLSDGLGSGIKASILSILTTEIITTLFEKGVEITDVVHTVASTLPVCKIRNIAYSTFTIVQIFNDGKINLVNYDNPEPIIIKDGELFHINYYEEEIGGKKIKIANFYLNPDDFIFIMSDGLIHAGLGNMIDFGWGTANVSQYLKRMLRRTRDIKYMVDNIVDLTNSYYGFRAGDDTTLIAMKMIEKPEVVVFTGPPLDPKTDNYYVHKFMNFEGKKVICGGTTGNIVSRIVNKEIEIDLNSVGNSEVPPFGHLEGVELVTEGVLTIQTLDKLLGKCNNSMFELDFNDNMNAAERLFLTLRDCDHITFFVGRKVNSFYHNPALPFDMSIRSNLIRGIVKNLEKLGKKVTVEYC